MLEAENGFDEFLSMGSVAPGGLIGWTRTRVDRNKAKLTPFHPVSRNEKTILPFSSIISPTSASPSESTPHHTTGYKQC